MSKNLESGKWNPPEGLSERSKALWTKLVPYRAKSAGRLELLALALTVLDRIAELRLVVGSDFVVESLTTRTKRVHPAAKMLADSEKQFRQLWGDLGLAWDSRTDGQVTIGDLDLLDDQEDYE